ncbi:MAG: molybdate ABC transporter substrate-binding protein, partial [Methylococcales bacterium]|nr:molybdate ABC transporter substrate-binding protein [Methylococcales bacterium]
MLRQIASFRLKDALKRAVTLNASMVKISLIVIIGFFNVQVRAADNPVIAVAASFKFAAKDIATAFHQDTGKKVRISYGSSGNLTRQIQQGSPFELFLSANSDYIKQLYQQERTLDKGMAFALGRLVLLKSRQELIPIDKQLNVIQQALINDQFKHVAIANPVHAPYGIAAREVLQYQDLWKDIQSHLVFGENAAQATQFVSSGAAQFGLVS